MANEVDILFEFNILTLDWQNKWGQHNVIVLGWVSGCNRDLEENKWNDKC